MADELNLIAVDLGASGGRVLGARLCDGWITLQEAHRFEHGPRKGDDGLWHWDIQHIWSQVKRGIAAAAQSVEHLDGIAIDGWGVDYALLDAQGELVRQPVAYRDPRTDRTFPRVIDRLGREAIYERTGIQFMPINTIYQLAADVEDPSRPLERAAVMLMIPQLLSYWLTGQPVAEHTMASTTQIYDARSRQWITDFAESLGVASHLFPPVVDAGAVMGTVRAEIAEELKLPGAGVPGAGTPRLAGGGKQRLAVKVIATASHDTAAAVAATPLSSASSAYLSSGTWSLLGVELDAPLHTAEALSANLTNEAGVAGTTRLLKNVTGLWLVQECRRIWAEAGDAHSYEQLTQWAAACKPCESLIDPNDPVFAAPGDMPARVRAASGLPLETPGEVVRCILDSLAASYAKVLDMIAKVTGRPIDTLHIVGGGGHNKLLNQLTANATALPVTVGPYEATSIGNALVQAMALGVVSDLREARRIVAESFELTSYEPQ